MTMNPTPEMVENGKKLVANTTSKRSNRNPYKDLSFSKSSFLRKFVIYLVSFCSFLSIFSGLQICQISQSPSPQHQLSGFACDHCVSYWSKGTLILTTASNMYKWLLVLKLCIFFHFPKLIHKNSAFSFACIFMTQWRRQDDEDLGWLWFPVTFFSSEGQVESKSLDKMKIRRQIHFVSGIQPFFLRIKQCWR